MTRCDIFVATSGVIRTKRRRYSHEKRERVAKYLKETVSIESVVLSGMAGNIGDPGTFVCAEFYSVSAFFTFFAYRNMKADELFWNNVRMAGTRAFWSGFTLIVGGMVILFIRGMTMGYGKEYELAIQGNVATISVFSLEQYIIGFLVLVFSMVCMILVFSISMLRIRRKEKKLLEEESGESKCFIQD